MSTAKHNYALPQKIIKLSKASTWDKAKQEWKFDRITISKKTNNCLCGHPIKELCILKNKYSGEEIIVGNCCIKKFLGLNSNKIFQSVKRVKSDIKKSFNADFIQLAYDRNIIRYKDYNFYINIWRKRKLSYKQKKWKEDINERILCSKYFRFGK